MNSATVDVYDSINNLFTNPLIFVVLLIIIISYILLFSSLGGNEQETGIEDGSDSGQQTLMVVVFAVLLVLILLNLFNYFFSVDVMASINNFFQETPKINIVVDQSNAQQATPPAVPEITLQKQVFNIPGNNYDYENSGALCKAYGGRLATYSEIENSYNSGAEWCNYGWSDGQMALFPTQQKTFDNLQKIAGHENDCGRTGINGGYMANPRLKFGVNCYGYKPKITPEEQQLMSSTTPYPQTQKDIDFQNEIDYWKTQITNILVSPFNYKNWSRI
jgi:hypothetical protein